MTSVHSICRYPGRDADWQSFESRFIVKAVKGHEISDKFNITLTASGKEIKFDRGNASELANMTASWIGGLIAQNHHSIAIIPIPNSTSTSASSDFKNAEFARNVAKYAEGSNVFPFLRFGEIRTPASRGGSRVYRSIKENYIWNNDTIPTSAVLVDDVMTTGNHMKAAYHFLKESGCKIEACYVVARTCWNIGGDKPIGLESKALFDS